MRANEFITEVFQPGKTNWQWKFRGSEEARADFAVGDRTYHCKHLRIFAVIPLSGKFNS